MRKYILKCTKTGKEWKEFTSGADFLEVKNFTGLNGNLIRLLTICVHGGEQKKTSPYFY